MILVYVPKYIRIVPHDPTDGMTYILFGYSVTNRKKTFMLANDLFYFEV